jgi:hypothetical protein
MTIAEIAILSVLIAVVVVSVWLGFLRREFWLFSPTLLGLARDRWRTFLKKEGRLSTALRGGTPMTTEQWNQSNKSWQSTVT